ncbi:MAG: FG-GAP repeat domain-containing protein, partial [Caldilineaceae bacterium]
MASPLTAQGRRARRSFSLLMLATLMLAALPHSSQAAPLRQEPPAPVGAEILAVTPDDPSAPSVYPQAAQGLPLEGPLVINGATPGAHSVRTADFDSDGDTDVLSAARDSGQIIWYRNNGGATPLFEPRLVAIAPGAYLAFPADMNQDGRPDIVVAAVGTVDPSSASLLLPAAPDEPAAPQGSGLLLWFENDGQPTPGFVSRTAAAALNYPVSAASA